MQPAEPRDGWAAPIRVRVKDIGTGREEFVELGAWDTIGILKRRIEAKGLGPSAWQRVVFQGRILKDEETLVQAGVAATPFVVLSVKALAPGGGTGAATLAPGARNASLYATSPAEEHRNAQAAGGGAQRGALESDDGDEPSCRICHGTEHEAQGDGKLFSPCRCRGSMRFVHVGCLNRWRALSVNPRSYFQCDACQHQYRIERTKWASMCQSYRVHDVATVVVCILLVLLFGCVAQFSRVEQYLYSSCDWAPPWTATATAPLFDLCMCGLIVLGAIGFVLAAHIAYVQDWRQLGSSLLFLAAGHGTMAVRVLCFVGLLHSLRVVHTRVGEELKAILSKFGDAILEVDGRAAPLPAPGG